MELLPALAGMVVCLAMMLVVMPLAMRVTRRLRRDSTPPTPPTPESTTSGAPATTADEDTARDRR